MSITNSHKDVVKKFYEVFNNGNFDEYDNILSKDVIEHSQDPTVHSSKKGLDYVKEVNSAYNKAFPDGKIEVQHLVEEGDKVIAHWKAKGTNTGELAGMPATNKTAEIEGFEMFCFKGDKISEHWGIFDNLSMMNQLGLTGNGSAGSGSQSGNPSRGNV